MKGKTRIAVTISLAGLLSLGSTSCSLIGYSIGKGIDYRNGEPRIVAARHVEKLESGSRVMILSKGSTLCEGKLGEISKDPSADYQKRYARRPAPPAESLFSPALGDTVIDIGFPAEYLSPTLVQLTMKSVG